ncbi:hypothetical protein ASPZODRAFT_29350 [Penicilliopsis zonata CBS 506.65]|uniref:Uncharacterized protein n=1 Tax=Penicilliopsis zonata CBS 506.65 TaxID=1073090 RepID=A0A1L9S4Y3_9EURO|nr:hypothetical protein ASPZODRAFT_29350 [Penicilliopsis zonata CBS 506.65]OJJ42216.1 hypothetical protein ASPZODRAFT_29350 [Penicilliopsis zonata CBS 506.65]
MTKVGKVTIIIVGPVLADIFLLLMGILGCVKQTNAISNAIGGLLADVISRITFNLQSFTTNNLLCLMLTGSPGI